MVQVLEVTPEERPVVGFALARVIPILSEAASEDRRVAANLSYILSSLDSAPAGPGEIEMQIGDLFSLGTRLYACGVDLEEYWLDRIQTAHGLPPAEREDPEVSFPARRYFPMLDANPISWSYRSVDPAFISLGFKLDNLTTAEAPRGRGLYNKSRAATVHAAVARRERNAAVRGEVPLGNQPMPDMMMLPAGAAPVFVDEAPHARAVGTALAPAGRAASGLSRISAASYPPQYPWGVETGTGVDVEDLEPGRPKRVNVGGAELMLMNTEGKICATARTCPHRGWDLSKGPVEDGVITCTLHGAQFDACSGEVLRQPYSPEFNRTHPMLGGVMSGLDPKKTTEPLQTYPTVVADDGEVRVHI
jgi:nitrite reductase/ring-hydroxylating ferredoxin subunit